MRKLRSVLPLATALSVLALVACGDDAANETTPTETGGSAEKAQLDLTIGSLLPLTGEQAAFGVPWQKASDVALAQIKAAAEEAGAEHSVELLHEDTQGDPQAAVQAARKVEGAGASCISGPSSSAEAIPVAQAVSLRSGILQITTATSDEITRLDDPDGLVNRTDPPDSFQGPTLADFIASELGGAEGKVVNVGARNDAYGTGLADTFSAAWEKLGGKVGAKVIYDPKQPSYNSEAQKIAAGNPDAWVIVDFPETYSKVGPALVRTGEWDPAKTFTADGLYSSDLGKTAGAEAVDGIRGTTPGAPDDGGATQAFDALYTSSEPADVARQAFDAQVFDNVVLCYLAAVAAGSTDGKAMAAKVRDVSRAPGTKYTLAELPAAIEALEAGEDIDYEGASGSLELDDAGDATAGVYDTFVFEGGAPAPLGELPVNKGS